MRLQYLVAAINRSDTYGWFVIRARDGQAVATGMSRLQATTLAKLLNFATSRVGVPWWAARDPEPPE